MEILKKYKMVGIIVVIIIVLILAFAVGGDKESTSKPATELSNDAEVILANAEAESAAVKEEDKKDFVQIDLAKYLDYYAASEARIILIARPTCSYCAIATPIIQKLMKDYNLEVNYLNTDNLTEEEQMTVIKSDEFFSNSFGTPMLLIVKDSSIVDIVDGMTDTAHYIEFFRVNGFIK